MKIDGISVIVSTFDDPINFISQCLDSLMFQEKISDIIIIDSSKKDEIKRLCRSLEIKSNKINYFYTPPKGLSDARNKGIQLSKKDIVAFTDADCIVNKDWAENICNAFEIDNENIAIVGGKVIPRWIVRPNKVFLNSAIAQGFYSSFDMGEELKEVEQVFGANFVINKRLTTDQIFMSTLGRKKENLLCGEEVDFCRRIKAKNFKIIYNPKMVVCHQIPEERTKFNWVWRRMYYGGITRAMLGGQPTPKTVNISYNIYDAIFLTIFIFPYLYGIFKVKFNGIFE